MSRSPIRLFQAIFRLDLKAVCEESTDDMDFHDYPDSEEGVPMSMYNYKCKRCGKGFTI